MSKTNFLIFVVLAILLSICPVNATVINAYAVNSYSVTADPGSVIYEIIIDGIPIGTNQTHVLNYNGAPFLLDIQTASSWGIYKEAWITLTLPNGTVQTSHTAVTSLPNSYKTTIQPVFSQAESGTVVFLTVDLMIGLSPAAAQFSTAPMGWNPSTAVPFSSASGNLGAETNVFIHEITLQEFNDNVVNYNPAYGLKNLGSDVFQWTWSQVLGFINQIPILGPLAVTMISYSGLFLGELVFWLGFIIMNFPAILLSLEALIMLFAMLNAGKKPKIQKIFNNIYVYNVAAITGIFWIFEKSFNIVKDIIGIIAQVIQSLKPL